MNFIEEVLLDATKQIIARVGWHGDQTDELVGLPVFELLNKGGIYGPESNTD